MPPSPEVRRVAFARWVERALHDAKINRGWTRTKVIEESGVRRTTLYRWLRGDWSDEPEAAKVRDFCDALDIPPMIPFMILWPGKRDRAPEPAPAPMDPDVELVLRRIADPTVPETEKYHIRETIRSLAVRNPRRAQRDDRAS